MLYLLQLVQALRYENFTQIADDFEREKKLQVPVTPSSLHRSSVSSHSFVAEHPLAESNEEDAPQLQESLSASDTLQDALKDPSYIPTVVQVSSLDLISWRFDVYHILIFSGGFSHLSHPTCLQQLHPGKLFLLVN
jgi:hypothetical protein